MKTALTILACFAGVFGFALTLAGLIGLSAVDPPDDKPTIGEIADHVFFGGIFSTFGHAADNWDTRPCDRRTFSIGAACCVLCVILIVVVGAMR